MRLDELSSLVLEGVVDAVSPIDIVDFSLVCKAIYRTAERRLNRHKFLVKTFSYIGLHEDLDTHTGLFWLLHQIQEDPSISYYPRRITFYPNYFRSRSKPGKSIDCNTEVLFDLGVGRINDDTKAEFRVKIEERDECAAFVLLLALCPYVRELSLLGYLGVYHDMLCRFLNLSDHTSAQSSPTPYDVEDHALPRVSTIYIRHWDSRYGKPLHDYSKLRSLPNLKKIHGHMISNRGHDNERWDYIEDLDHHNPLVSYR